MNQKLIKDIKREVKVPELVTKKVEDSIEQCMEMSPPSGKSKTKFHFSAAACLLLALVLVGGGTAAAFAFHPWDKGISDSMQLHDVREQNHLNETGLSEFPDQAVTINDVTITATQTITDGDTCMIAFRVEGYHPQENLQPAFWDTTVTTDGERVDANYFADFYDGTIQSSTGMVANADGTPISKDSDGSLVFSYLREDGSMEYQILLQHTDTRQEFSDNKEGYFLNRSLHVELNGLGYYPGKAEEPVVEKEGVWSFDITLSGSPERKHFEPDIPIPDTDATLVNVELSPISIILKYRYPSKEALESSHTSEDTENASIGPFILGLKMKDGTIFPYVLDAGVNEWKDTTEIQKYTLNRIVNMDDVESLLFKKKDCDTLGSEMTLDCVHEIKIQ